MEPNNENIEIGTRIKAIRINLGLTMEEFGNKFDPVANKSLVSKWESGKSLPNNERLKRISELGNVTMTYLLEGKIMLGDIHMMPKEEQEKLWKQQKKQFENIRLNFINSTQSNLDDIDLNTLPDNELYLLNHFTRFMKNYRGVNDGNLINSMFATFAQLNRLYNDYCDPKLSIEDKNKKIDFYINDLLNESTSYYKELANFLKNSLN